MATVVPNPQGFKTVIPWFRDGKDLTGRVTGADIAAGTLVKYVVGGTSQVPNVSTAAAGDVCAGIAGKDAKVGEIVHYIAGGVMEGVAGADLIANDEVQAGPDGTLIKLAAGKKVGVITCNIASGGAAAVRLSV